MTPLLQLTNIRKEYPGVLALADVSFGLRSGEVHCLVGENGAGKSTLINIMSGAIAADSGSIAVSGLQCEIRTPADAQRHGIAVIHQDFKLVPELTVAENIFLGREPRNARLPFIDSSKMRREAKELLSRLGEEIDPSTKIRSLSIAGRQMVEIAKALSRNARILAMDEPSAVLTGRELETLFNVVRQLVADGVGIIYISHRLEEVFEIGSRVTVLRDGKVITTCDVAVTNRNQLIQWMVGRPLEQEYPKVISPPGQEVLRLDCVSGGIVEDVSLAVHAGEVLGLGGLVGAGRSELARIIFGADPLQRGRIMLNGSEIHPASPREAIDLGIGFLSEDRNLFGLILQMGVGHNITLSILRSLTRGSLVDERKEREMVESSIQDLQIKTPSHHTRVDQLSGGNRQKVVLARWLLMNSKVLIFDEPTAGIDVGVKYEIYQLINRLTARGIAVMMISSDLPELIGISDRIAVTCEGRLAGILARAHATQEAVMKLATPGRMKQNAA